MYKLILATNEPCRLLKPQQQLVELASQLALPVDNQGRDHFSLAHFSVSTIADISY